ncbi:MAG: hypothetical protein CMC70_04275 [Flavobacteriaceae bacterium]|nr:hypothetical protein [Flavobacteriaceae bacterium]
MDKLKLNLINCYGINKLEQELTFGDFNTIVVYASNGIMKTSLANTFNAIQKGEQPKDRLFNKPSTCEITCDGIAIKPEMISVIKSFDDIDTIPSQTKLLVDEDSKKEYDEIYQDIEEKKHKLIISLNKKSGVKKDDIEKTICNAFRKNDFYEILSDFENLEVGDDFSEIKYNEIFNPDVISFLKQPNVIKDIEDYFEKYQTILEKSSLYKAGIFNPSKADNVAASLKKENFFNAEHSVKLKGVEKEFKNFEALNQKLTEEKKEIIENEDLLKIEKQIKKVAVKNLREILEKNRIVKELINLDDFNMKLWLSYFDKERFYISELLETYKNGLAKLKEIEEKAEQQATVWDEVIKKFKARFSVPFDVRIKNKSSSILGKDVPNINFIFTDDITGNESAFEQKELGRKEILSQGEKRAMYLLNVMFNIEARLEEGIPTLYIIDDVADSFDYKNKYAIIQYLKDIAEIEDNYQIILTHNYDFFRTLQSRILGGSKRRSHSFVTIKEDSEITLIQSGHKYQDEPFNDWKKKLNEVRPLLSSIPFVRNILEFKSGNGTEHFKTLTSLLHCKTDTQTITIADIKAIYNDTISSNGLDTHDNNESIHNLLMIEAEDIFNNHTEISINLEEKIILSIATRIKAEEYMWSKVNDKSEITNSQTGKLFNRFKLEHGETLINELNVLEEVNLVTPENIHLNSFMFEPIIDLSMNHLKKIYNDVKNL